MPAQEAGLMRVQAAAFIPDLVGASTLAPAVACMQDRAAVSTQGREADPTPVQAVASMRGHPHRTATRGHSARA